MLNAARLPGIKADLHNLDQRLLRVAKPRNGPTGDGAVYFESEYMFSSPDRSSITGKGPRFVG